MGNILKFELSKIKSHKSLFICTGIMVFSVLLNVLTFWGMAKLMSGELGAMEDLGVIIGFDMITSVLQAANNGSLTIIAGIVISIFVCSDYAQGTIKVIVARGYSRTKVYFAKLVAVSVIVLMMFAVCLIFGWLFGVIFFGFGSVAGMKWLAIIAVQLVSVLAFAAFAFFFAALFRKIAPSIIMIIVLPTVIELVLTLIDVFASTSLSDYWITSVFVSLATMSVSVSRIVIALVVSVVYTGVFIVLGWLASKKRSY